MRGLRVPTTVLAVLFFAVGCATTKEGSDAAPDMAPDESVAVESAIVEKAELGLLPQEGEEPGDGVVPIDGPSDLAGLTSSDELFEEYRIGPGDVLSFRSFDDPSLDAIVSVRYDGCISLPLVPDVKVAGLTREDSLGLLRDAFSAHYTDPQLTLSVLEANSKSFTVMGDVARPAEYPYIRPLTLLDSINTAGGLRIYQRGGDQYVSSQGQLIKALIIRTVDGDRRVYEIDLRGFQEPGDHPSTVAVIPGDIVYVPESVNLVYVLGEVRSPGVFAMSEGLSVLEVLALAGGFSESSGRLSQVALIRDIDPGNTEVRLIDVREALKTGKDELLEPGDIVYVPRKRLVNLRDFVSRVTGTLTPIMSLYTQMYDTYYTRERFDRLFDDRQVNTTNDVLLFLQSLQDVGSVIGSIPIPAGR